nr:hypothetical protein [Tanacetum cinerariifolium]
HLRQLGLLPGNAGVGQAGGAAVHAGQGQRLGEGELVVAVLGVVLPVAAGERGAAEVVGRAANGLLGFERPGAGQHRAVGLQSLADG